MIETANHLQDVLETRRDPDLTRSIVTPRLDGTVFLDNQCVVRASGNLRDILHTRRYRSLPIAIVTPAEDNPLIRQCHTMRTTSGNCCDVAAGCSRERDLPLGVRTPAIDFASFERERKVRTDGDIGYTRSTAGWDVGLALTIHPPGSQGAILQQTEDKRSTYCSLLHE